MNFHPPFGRDLPNLSEFTVNKTLWRKTRQIEIRHRFFFMAPSFSLKNIIFFNFYPLKSFSFAL